MDKNQAKIHASDTKGKTKEVASKEIDEQSTENNKKAEKTGGKNGTVLGEVNGDGRKSAK